MENLTLLTAKQNAFFRTGQTMDPSFRLAALEKLRQAVKKHEAAISRALKSDLNKSEFEAYATEIGLVLKELRFISKHLRSWMKPKKVKTPLTHIGSRSSTVAEPYGRMLIIAPWNYPFQLVLMPLAGAIAAGNCAVVKPSELTPQTSRVLAELIAESFPDDYISVVQGGVETNQRLLKEKFDYIFFTGSEAVGRIVMQEAAVQLTPVTLELGGKSPCIVHRDANIKLAAKRIAWGKFLNAGQTCVAPDYVYVHASIKERFLQELSEAVKSLYGENPLQTGNFTRIVSEKHLNRLRRLAENGTLLIGGRTDSAKLSMEPTVLTGISWEDEVMHEEIFGPILPVLAYSDLEEAVEAVKRRPAPLAFYLFCADKSIQEHVMQSVSFGGGCVNDTVYHFTSHYLPFGGAGSSGFGSYHGKASFDAFSRSKSILRQTTRFDLPFRYPNVKNSLSIIKRFLK